MSKDFKIKNGELIKYRGNDENVIIPDRVTKIGEYAFEECKKLVSVIIPHSVKEIELGAFFNCTRLESAIIPDSVTSIGDFAFSYCENLKCVTIPDSVTSIGFSVFRGCEEMQKLILSGNNKNYAVFDKILYDKNIKTLLCPVGRENLVSAVIPDGVQKIEEYAFFSCYGLTSVTIPDSVINIGYRAFGECSELNSVILGNGIKTIEMEAFSECEALTSVSLPDEIQSVEGFAFPPEIEIIYYDMKFMSDYDGNINLYEMFWNVFLCRPQEERVLVHIEKNFFSLLEWAVSQGNTEIIQKVLDSERLVTEQNIDDLILYAIENKKYEIQMLLTNYKNQKDWYQNIDQKLKL